MINSKIYNIKSRDIVGGYLPNTTLESLLVEHKDLIAGNICLAHAEDHTINVKYENNKWILYDPNYEHDTVEHMTKTFDSIEDCVKEIKIVLKTDSVALQLASINDDKKMKFVFFDQLTPAQIIQLIQQEGLQTIARRSPHQLKKIIDMSAQKPQLAEALADSLIRTNKLGWSGLLVMSRYAPIELDYLFNFAQKNKIIALALAQAIPVANKQQWNSLHMMASMAPSALITLLKLANNNKEVNKTILNTLNMPNQENTKKYDPSK